MNRRGFLKLFSVAAPTIVIATRIPSTRKYFFAPRHGWRPKMEHFGSFIEDGYYPFGPLQYDDLGPIYPASCWEYAGIIYGLPYYVNTSIGHDYVGVRRRA